MLALVAGLAVGAAGLAACARPGVSPPLLLVVLACFSCPPVSLLLLVLEQARAEWFWSSLYWGALLVGWLVAETLCRTLDAGEFSLLGRLSSAIRSSVRLYLLMCALLVAAAFYMLLSLQVSVSVMQGAARLLVNGFGVLVLALFEGHGLVAVPRALWRQAGHRACLNASCYHLAVIDQQHAAASKKLREVLHRITAIDAAAPPPASRSERERAQWEVLLRTARVAAASAGVTEADGASGGLSLQLRSAWAHTLGTPTSPDEAAMAKLRRRVKASGSAARRCWQRRRRALRRCAALWSALSAQEKGFGGAGVAASRGVWLGIARAPLLRLLALLAALLSLWLAAAELCATTRLLPEALAAPVFAQCPLVAARAQLQPSPALVALLHAATLGAAAVCFAASFSQSPWLAHVPLLLWRATDSYSLLRHAAWAARLTAPLASHFAFVSGIDAPGLCAASDEFAHGLGSLLVLAVAALAASGTCSRLIDQLVDPAYRTEATLAPPHYRATVKSGQRLVQAHLGSLGGGCEMVSCHGAAPLSPSLHGDAIDLDPEEAVADDLYEPVDLSAVSPAGASTPTRTHFHRSCPSSGEGRLPRATMREADCVGQRRDGRKHAWNRLVGVLAPSASDASEEMSSEDEEARCSKFVRAPSAAVGARSAPAAPQSSSRKQWAHLLSPHGSCNDCKSTESSAPAWSELSPCTRSGAATEHATPAREATTSGDGSLPSQHAWYSLVDRK